MHPHKASPLMNNVRLFAAIPLPENLKAKLHDFFVAHPFLKWTNPANTHLTLHFIGNVANENKIDIQQTLRETKFKPFNLAVKGLGVFQRQDSNVIWARIEKEPALLRLQAEIVRNLSGNPETGAKENRYRPHITLSRIGRKTVSGLKDFLSAHTAQVFGKFAVDNFCLYRSFLEQPAARHEIIESYPALEEK